MRRTLSLSRRAVLAAAAAPALASASASADAAPSGAFPLQFAGQPIRLDVKSAPVRWREHSYHLVSVGQASFLLSARHHLTGVLKAGITTFDSVDYEVHAALYDAAGRLLGTARALCPVERVWLGKVLNSSRELQLDFGINDAYERAKWFSVSITERQVVTPDQWQKG
jgi:hypothetical protein